MNTKKITLRYHRYGGEYSKQFSTPKKAAQWALTAELNGEISYEDIVDEDGTVLASNNLDGYKSLYALGAKG